MTDPTAATNLHLAVADGRLRRKPSAWRSYPHSVFVLVKLEEIVLLLEREGSLVALLREKVRSAIADKKPLFEPNKAF